jgi:opacity protein-like surface antigen
MDKKILAQIIESFYLKTNEKNQILKSDNFSTFDLRTRTLGFDFKPYLVFDKKSQALFYLILGFNYNHIDITEVNQIKTYGNNGIASKKISSRNSSVNKFSPTFGLGVEYLFYRNFVLRFQYKRNFVDAKILNSEVLNKIKIIENLGVGLSHSF